MIITTLIVCFLLALMPLVIGAFSVRYSSNIFSKTILTLSALSFLLGLAQFTLILGMSCKLFSPAHMKQAPWAIQYVSIAGGAIMIIAGLAWIGYFQTLIKQKAAAKQPRRVEKFRPKLEEAAPVRIAPPPAAVAMAAPATPAPARRRRPQPEPVMDWFSDEVPGGRAVKLAAVVTPKKRPRAKASEIRVQANA